VRTARTRPFALPDGDGGLEATHLRHLHVHEDEVEGLVLQGFQCRRARGRNDDLVSSLFQEPNRQELIHGIVFGHEHPQAPLRLPQ